MSISDYIFREIGIWVVIVAGLGLVILGISKLIEIISRKESR